MLPADVKRITMKFEEVRSSLRQTEQIYDMWYMNLENFGLPYTANYPEYSETFNKQQEYADWTMQEAEVKLSELRMYLSDLQMWFDHMWLEEAMEREEV